ncbi:MAG: hypothetical protein AB1690_02790, partial [Candidatus Zixiibacteriota bacterium]
MKIRSLLLLLSLLGLVNLNSVGQTVRDVRGRLGEKSTFEPTKISVEEVRYVGINYISANDSIIMNNCAEILRNDLDFSPFFEVVYLDSFFMRHMELQEMTLLGWSWMGSSYVVKLDAEFPHNNIRLRYYLYATDSQREIRKERFESDKNDYRALVHEMANDIYRALTGDEGVYRTKIAYVKQVGK